MLKIISQQKLPHKDTNVAYRERTQHFFFPFAPSRAHYTKHSVVTNEARTQSSRSPKNVGRCSRAQETAQMIEYTEFKKTALTPPTLVAFVEATYVLHRGIATVYSGFNNENAICCPPLLSTIQCSTSFHFHLALSLPLFLHAVAVRAARSLKADVSRKELNTSVKLYTFTYTLTQDNPRRCLDRCSCALPGSHPDTCFYSANHTSARAL